MKTRIIYTKIWEDDFVSTLTLVQKALFIYLITNQRIGQTGIYEISDRIILFETGATKEQLAQVKEVFHTANKILFTNGWVKVVKSEKYNSYTGESNKISRTRELEAIPVEILESFDTVPTPSLQGGGSSSNHNKESVISNKGVVKGILDITETEVLEIAANYQVPEAFVRSKMEDIQNYCDSHGKKYKDYKATLRNWVKKDAIKVIQDARKGVKSYDATKVLHSPSGQRGNNPDARGIPRIEGLGLAGDKPSVVLEQDDLDPAHQVDTRTG